MINGFLHGIQCAMDMIYNTLLSASTAVAAGEPTMIAQVGTLVMLIALQAVLGFDNLLYISLESKRAPLESQARVRKWGIGIAVALRIVLLFTLVALVSKISSSLFAVDTEWVKGDFNLHAIIVLIGGVFILYTATKEVLHMMRIEYGHGMDTKPASVKKVVTMIVTVNVVFSFDSILSAMALAQYKETDGSVQHLMWVMVVAILISGVLMIWLADKVSEFLQRNRMYEVLGLFILFVVGIMLITEGAHLGHLTLFGNAIMPMTKTTFYFVIAILVVTDIVQTRYQKKIFAERDRAGAGDNAA